MLLCHAVAACQTTDGGGIEMTAAPIRSVPCASLRPIFWSHRDTRETQEQATEDNAVKAKSCGWMPPKRPTGKTAP